MRYDRDAALTYAQTWLHARQELRRAEQAARRQPGNEDVRLYWATAVRLEWQARNNFRDYRSWR